MFSCLSLSEAEQQRHDAEEDDDDAEDGNALALVPIQYQGGDQNYDSQPFTMSGPSSSFCGPYSQADFGGLSQYTPASQVYDPSQPGSSHHNAPSNIIPQFGGQNRPAYNTSPWSHPVGDFIVEDSSGQPGIGTQNIGMPSTADFLDIQEPQEVQEPQEPQRRQSTRIRFPTVCGTHPRQRHR
nr:hypothetical protein Iba_chr14dCG3040 [Ipomoea batatas]